MPLNAGDTGYGSVPSPRLQGAAGGSEAAPLLIPEPEPESGRQWEPMSRRELEVIAGGPGWRKVRCYLVLLFWLTWVSMLAVSIAIITISPRPVVTPLRWWQKSLFYQLEPELLLEARGSEGISCEQLPFLRSLGVGALILEGLFKREASPLNLTAVGRNLDTETQIQHLLLDSNKAVKVVLDFCELDLHALRYWLEKGVAGFAICDTDAAYSEKTLLEWRGIFREFSTEEEEALFTSLSRSRSREEALLYGSFTFLPFNTSSTSNSTFSSPSSPPVLAFLRSWGCVHFLVLLNIGPEVHPLDPNWASNLPEAGVFVTSTGMDRLGSTSLYTLQLQPHEAIVIKLF
uniref:Si:dkey-202g17.3 n=1 Tax=Acanthochromis polyacanthus TaxID=80966 RepID=A0A3Q1FD02_9TELE